MSAPLSGGGVAGTGVGGPGPGPNEALVVADAAAWRAWLDLHEESSDGVWLLLAKKGTTEPTSLDYQEALLEALCSGWIDGQRKSVDAATFKQRYTPRRKASLWSLRNIDLVAQLIAAERMRERGHAEIDRAKGDGRWERAYAGPAAAEPPREFLEALAASPAALAVYESMTRSQRYSVFHTLITATTPAVLAARVARAVERLESGAQE